MSDKASSTEKVRICKACKRENPPDEDICQKCYADLPPATEKSATDDTGSSEEEPKADDSNFREKGRNPENECPECGADVGSLPVCPRCGKSFTSFRLCWQEVDLKNVPITCERPLFVGRIPPVDNELARHIDAGFPCVSRMHAEIFLERDGNLYLRDLESKNGTYVNQKRVAAYIPQRLQAGDTLSFSSKLSARVEKS